MDAESPLQSQRGSSVFHSGDSAGAESPLQSQRGSSVFLSGLSADATG